METEFQNIARKGKSKVSYTWASNELDKCGRVYGFTSTEVAQKMILTDFNVVISLILKVLVNNFSVMLGRSHRFLCIYQYFISVLLKDTT